MGASFRPSVTPTPRAEMGGAERFLDTLTRSFMQARDLVESDTQRRRARERFQTEQETARLQNEALEQELRIRTRAQAIEEAKDPTLRTRAELDFPVPATPFPGAEAPPGAAISEDLARTLERPLTQYGPRGPVSEVLPEGVEAIPGQEDIFYDPFGGQELEQQGRVQEAEFIAEELERQAAAQTDPAIAESIRSSIPRAVSDVISGRKPSQYDVAGRLEVERARAEHRLRVQTELNRQRGELEMRKAGISANTEAGRRELNLINAQQDQILLMMRLGAAAAPTKESLLADILDPEASAATREALQDALDLWKQNQEQLDRLQTQRSQGGTGTRPPAAAEPATTGLGEPITQQDWDDLVADGMTPDEIRAAFNVPAGVGG